MGEGSMVGNTSLPERLFNKDFLILWFGQIVSSTGNSIQYIAVMWWIMQAVPAKESGIAMGLMFTFSTIPLAAMGPFAGVLADRISRKAIVVLSDAVRGTTILWMAYLAYTGHLTIPWIYAISAVMGVGAAFFNPAIQSTLPNIVPNKQLVRANGMYQTGIQFTNIIGPAIGGVLVGFLGPAFVFALNGVSFVFSAVTELFINFRQKFSKPDGAFSFFRDMKEGLKFIYAKKLIFWSMIDIAVINFAFAPIDILIAKQVKEVYGLGALELGYVVSAFAIGMIVGTVILSIIPEIKLKHNVVIAGAVSTGALFVFFGMAPNLVSFLAIALLMGFILSLVNVNLQVIMQRMVPDEKRGRVFSVMITFETMLQPVSMAVIGAASASVSNAVIFAVLGTIVGVVSAFLYLVPGIKEV